MHEFFTALQVEWYNFFVMQGKKNRNQRLVSGKEKFKNYMENYLKINYMEELERKKAEDLVVRRGEVFETETCRKK